MKIRRSLCALGLLCVVAPLARADVIVVPAGSPRGALDAAVTAAKDGDILYVYPSVSSNGYLSFALDGKGVSIIGAGGLSLIPIEGTNAIMNLPAGSDVLLSGLELRAGDADDYETPSDPGANTIYATDNAGSIRVVHCTAVGTESSRFILEGGAAAKLTNSIDVAFARCMLNGGPAYALDWSDNGGAGGSGLHSIGSITALYDCSLIGSPGGVGGARAGDGGSSAQLFSSSALFAGGSAFLGGAGGFSVCCQAPGGSCPNHMGGQTTAGRGGNGGSGLRVNDATIAQLLDDSYTVGQGGQSSCGGANNGAPGATLAVAPTGSAFTFNAQAHELTAPRVVREGTRAMVSIAGTPGEEVFLLTAGGTSFTSVVSARGVLLPASSAVGPQRWKRLGFIPGSGVLSHNVSVADLGDGVLARIAHVQALVKSANGTSTLSSYAAIAYIDSSL